MAHDVFSRKGIVFKKVAIALFALFIILAGGCAAPTAPLSAPTISVSSYASEETVTPVTPDPNPEPPAAKQTMEAAFTLAPSPTYAASGSGKVEIGQKVFFTYTEMDTLYAYAACEVKNVGNVPVSIDELTYTALDKNNKVLMSFEGFPCIPDYLDPGQTGYSMVEYHSMDGVDPASIVKIVVAGEYSQTDRHPVMLSVSNITYTPPISKPVSYYVACDVKNDSQTAAQNIQLACAFYDESNNLLGISMNVSVGEDLDPGEMIRFGFGNYHFPFEMRKKIASYNVIAFNYTG